MESGKIGMSWYFAKPDGKYVQSTIEEINGTMQLIAMPDGSNHVSVRPIVDDKNFSKLKSWTATKKYVSHDKRYSD